MIVEMQNNSGREYVERGGYAAKSTVNAVQIIFRYRKNLMHNLDSTE